MPSTFPGPVSAQVSASASEEVGRRDITLRGGGGSSVMDETPSKKTGSDSSWWTYSNSRVRNNKGAHFIVNKELPKLYPLRTELCQGNIKLYFDIPQFIDSEIRRRWLNIIFEKDKVPINQHSQNNADDVAIRW